MGWIRGVISKTRLARFASAMAASVALVASSIVPAQAAELNLTAPVQISGVWAVGQNITISDFNASEKIKPEYTWFVDGEMIGGAKDASLYLSQNLTGRKVSLQVRYRDTVSNAETTVAVAPEIRIFGESPTGGGQMGFNGELIKVPGCFAPRASSTSKPTVGWPVSMTCQVYNTSYGAPQSQTFDWYRNAKLVESQGPASRIISPEDANQRLFVSFTAKWPNGAVMTQLSAVKEVALPKAQIQSVVISGAVKTGSTLKALVSGVASNATVSYTWYSDYKVIAGQTGQTLAVTKEHLGKAIHVLVVAAQKDHDSSSLVSKPVASGKLPDLDVKANGYQPIFSSIKASQTQYDIKYVTSPKISPEMLARQQRLLQRAADYWIPEYKPVGVQVLYFTESEGQWADDFIATQPNWSNGTGGTIQNRIKQNGCGFAIAFKANGRQVFLQCLSETEADLAYDQVGPHEYSHWVQYEIESNLFVRMPAWLVEGTANYYGIAIGLAEADGGMQAANGSLAGHATQFDLGMRYRFASFKLLDMFRAGSVDDVTVILNRSGPVWEQYLMGSLVSEWLVWKYGAPTYFAWVKEVIDTRSGWEKTDYGPTHAIFKKHFGFDWADLSLQIAPYLATRADQLQSAWVVQNLLKIQEPKSTVAGFKYDFPAFPSGQTEITGEARGWLHQRLANTGVRSVQCVGFTSVKPTAAAKRLAQARAKSACDEASRFITEQQRTATIKVTVATTKEKSLISQVEVKLR